MKMSNPPLHFCVLIPPFYSHFHPMMTLAKAFKECGAKVTAATALSFKKEIDKEGLLFIEISINKNANTGTASKTHQTDEEKQRLIDFFAATKKGPVETLLIQGIHRKKDMLANPKELLMRLREIKKEIRPDYWVVDQLSYGATVSLYSLEENFITFCPPHPFSLPCEGRTYSVPPRWPSPFKIPEEMKQKLHSFARQVEGEFTAHFNEFILANDFHVPIIDNAFKLTSGTAVIFNYPDFRDEADLNSTPVRIFTGSCFEESALGSPWNDIVKRNFNPKILVALGTFLNNRRDVLERIILGIRNSFSNALLVVGAGESTASLQNLADSQTIIAEFIPQKALLPFMDMTVIHGGVGSFTESLYFGKPMIVLPFSSDQFNVAHDVEEFNLGKVLDPNTFQTTDIGHAVNSLLPERQNTDAVLWSQKIREKGPINTVKTLLRSLTSEHC